MIFRSRHCIGGSCRRRPIRVSTQQTETFAPASSVPSPTPPTPPWSTTKRLPRHRSRSVFVFLGRKRRKDFRGPSFVSRVFGRSPPISSTPEKICLFRVLLFFCFELAEDLPDDVRQPELSVQVLQGVASRLHRVLQQPQRPTPAALL